MKIVSFNVNGIRARLDHMVPFLRQFQPDILCLQEIKIIDEDFPRQLFEEEGYRVYTHGQKGHYGVATICRAEATTVTRGFPGEAEDAQRRFIATSFRSASGQTLKVLNGYFPNGESRLHPLKFPNKKQFYADLKRYLHEHCSPREWLVLLGDFNVAPADADVGIGEKNVRRWLKEGKCSFLPEEREWLQSLLDWGLTDSFRKHHPEVNDRFSWFDFRSKGFDDDPKRGLRIDMILATEPLSAYCSRAGIDYEFRGKVRPSDHCALWSEFDI